MRGLLEGHHPVWVMGEDAQFCIMHETPPQPRCSASILSLVLFFKNKSILFVLSRTYGQSCCTMEALGGAASVIGVASLAIEVCKGLNKIHDFWQSVKEAPDHIARISTETNLLITWLTVIGNNYQRQGFDDRNPNHVAATDTLKLCLAMVQDMNDEVDDLEGRLSTSLMSRRWASVKFVFRKEKRETLMDQIERMKSLLIIVQTCYIGYAVTFTLRAMDMDELISIVISKTQASDLYR